MIIGPGKVIADPFYQWRNRISYPPEGYKDPKVPVCVYDSNRRLISPISGNVASATAYISANDANEYSISAHEPAWDPAHPETYPGYPVVTWIGKYLTLYVLKEIRVSAEQWYYDPTHVRKFYQDANGNVAYADYTNNNFNFIHGVSGGHPQGKHFISIRFAPNKFNFVSSNSGVNLINNGGSFTYDSSHFNGINVSTLNPPNGITIETFVTYKGAANFQSGPGIPLIIRSNELGKTDGLAFDWGTREYPIGMINDEDLTNYNDSISVRTQIKLSKSQLNTLSSVTGIFYCGIGIGLFTTFTLDSEFGFYKSIIQFGMGLNTY